MTMTQEFSDEQLVAFLDGESDFAPTESISRALKADAALATRIEQLKIDRDAVATEFAHLLKNSPAMPDLPEASAVVGAPTFSGHRFGFGAMAAAVLLAVFVGFGVGYQFPDTAKPTWKQQVASYQSLYSTATLSHVDRSQEETLQELERVAASIGIDIGVKDLQVEPDTRYKRAQILKLGDKPLIQLAFLTSDGAPIALCIVKSNKPDSSDFQVEKMWGMSATSWAKGGFEFLLIGGDDDKAISRLAQKYSKTI